LVRLIPSAQLCRFGLSGSEMVQTAMRLARAVTGRNMILRFEGHYHGWFDNVLLNVAPPLESIGPRERPPVQLMSAGQSPSVISDTLVLPWNDLALVEQLAAAEGEQIAAIICEPMMCNTGAIPPQPGYLNGLRAICDRIGALLIIDEVITGFRVGLQGAQGRFGVVPDLAIFGKAMAGGFAAAALVGRADVMIRVTQDVNHSGTFNSNVISMAATEAALAELEKDDGAIYRSMWQVGTRLMDGIRAIAARLDIPLLVQGLPTAFHVSFTDEPAIRDYRDYVYYCDRQRYSRFSLALLERGVRTIERGIWYLSAAHTSDHVDQTLEAVEGALRDTSD
jgi:glutamate-1-semialdehyde 2,1-aminomutase